MNNLQFIIYNSKRKLFASVLLCSIINFTLLIINCPVSAQTLGLSISPPIDEIMIIPGKEVTQTFTITNDGVDGMASIYIIPFKAQGENGNVALDEKNTVDSSSPYASWFSITSPVNSFGEKFYLAGGGRQDIIIKISPPSSANQKDYYFTLLYELDNQIPGGITPQGPTNQARIGANLLISLSKDGNPEKKINILEFSAPKIIDSLGKLTFNIRISNEGSYFFKPQGQITIKPTFGDSETLTIAPLNIISNSVRNIPCLENEDTMLCQSSHKVLLGVYKSTLVLKADENSGPQQKTVTTIAFPFTIIFAIIVVFVTYKIIKKPNNKRMNPLDNVKDELNNN